MSCVRTGVLVVLLLGWGPCVSTGDQAGRTRHTFTLLAAHRPVTIRRKIQLSKKDEGNSQACVWKACTRTRTPKILCLCIEPRGIRDSGLVSTGLYARKGRGGRGFCRPGVLKERAQVLTQEGSFPASSLDRRRWIVSLSQVSAEDEP